MNLEASLDGRIDHCLWCSKKVETRTSWQSFISNASHQYLCFSCKSLLQPLPKNCCVRCSRPLSIGGEHVECLDCRRWREKDNMGDTLEHNLSLYVYNESAKELISRWKYRGDAILALIFRTELRRLYLQKYWDHLPIPIPISDKRMLERGFNQSELLLSFLLEPLSLVEKLSMILTRMKGKKREEIPPAASSMLLRLMDEKKQSKKTRYERMMATENPFRVNTKCSSTIKAKNIVLLDDIYTTGSTLRRAATELKSHGARSVRAITLFRGS